MDLYYPPMSCSVANELDSQTDSVPSPAHDARIIHEKSWKNIAVLQDNIPVLQDSIRVLQDSIRVLQDNVPVLQDNILVLQDNIPVLQDNIPVLQDNNCCLAGQQQQQIHAK